MTDLNGQGGGDGSRLPLLPVLLILVTAAVGALTTWAFKIDERLSLIGRDVPTRGELQILRAELASRLDRIDTSVTALLSRPAERRDP